MKSTYKKRKGYIFAVKLQCQFIGTNNHGHYRYFKWTTLNGSCQAGNNGVSDKSPIRTFKLSLPLI